MNDGALKVLLIDDDEEDALLTKDVLAEVKDTRYETTWVSRGEDALPALAAGEHDVCLLDYRLTGETGLDVLAEARRVGCTIPIIMLTGAPDHEIDMAAMDAGAADYLVKDKIDPQLLERVIRYAIGHKKSQLALIRLNEEKSRFVGVAAHDLRSPLGVILGYSDFLLMTHGSSMRKGDLEIIRKIKSSSKFMLSLINDLLDISTIESGRLRLDQQSADLGPLVEANVGLNMVLAGQKDMTIALTCERDMPRVFVDTLKVEQVLNNLISNAIHYSPRGTTIRIGVRCAGDEAQISVEDEGPGIAPEDIAKLFRPFGRARTVSTGGERSTGLGLAIARRIVEGHGGRIWVESELGRGSTFYVAFPVADAADLTT